jgi:hypothetical protein
VHSPHWSAWPLLLTPISLAGCPPAPATAFVSSGGPSACGGDIGGWETVASDPNVSSVIAVANGTLFWIDQADDGNDTINAVALDSTNAPTVLFTASPGPNAAIADLVSDGKNLYFLQSQGGGEDWTEIDAMPLAGGAVTTLAKQDNTFYDVLAVAGDYVYATDIDGDTVGVPIAGGAAVAVGSSNADVALGLVGAGGSVYYVNYEDGLDEVSSPGDKPRTVAAPTGLTNNLSGNIALAANSSSIFWPCQDDTGALLCESSQNGGKVIALASLTGPEGVQVTADDQNAYFIDTGANCIALLSVSVAGNGAPSTIVSGFSTPSTQNLSHALALDDTYVYFVTQGQIVRTQKAQ